MTKRILSLLLSFAMLMTLGLTMVASAASVAGKQPYDFGGFYYSKLNENQKKAYRNICEKTTEGTSFPKRIAIPNMTKSEFEYATQAVCWDNPELFCLDYYDGAVVTALGTTYYIPSYTMKKDEYEKKLAKFRQEKDKIIAACKKQASTPYERELYVHDYIVDHASYPTGDEEAYEYHSIQAFFETGDVVCEGYSAVMKYLLNDMGIPCRLIAGNGYETSLNQGGHAWVAVTLGNKEYLVDPLWDDKEALFDDPIHVFYNLPASSFSGHISERLTDNLAADDDSQTYYIHFGLLYNDLDEATAKLPNVIAQNLGKGRTVVEFQFDGSRAYKAAKEKLLDQDGILPMIQNANAKVPANRRVLPGTYPYRYYDEYRVIVVQLVKA